MLSPRQIRNGFKSTAQSAKAVVNKIVSGRTAKLADDRTSVQAHKDEKKNAAHLVKTELQVSYPDLSPEQAFVLTTTSAGLPTVPPELRKHIHAYRQEIEQYSNQRELKDMHFRVESAAKNIKNNLTETYIHNTGIDSPAFHSMLREFEETLGSGPAGVNKSLKNDIKNSFNHLRLCLLNHDKVAAINEIDRIRQLSWRALYPGKDYLFTLTSNYLSDMQKKFKPDTKIQDGDILDQFTIESYGRSIYKEFTRKLWDLSSNGNIKKATIKEIEKDALKDEKRVRKLGYDTKVFKEQISNLTAMLRGKNISNGDRMLQLATIYTCKAADVIPDRTGDS